MRRIFYFLTIIILLLIIRNVVDSIQKMSDNSKTVGQLNRQLEEKKQENSFLKQKLSYVKSTGFIEKQARDKLELVKEGEYIVVMPEPEAKKGKEEQKELPNWQKWWNLFF